MRIGALKVLVLCGIARAIAPWGCAGTQGAVSPASNPPRAAANLSLSSAKDGLAQGEANEGEHATTCEVEATRTHCVVVHLKRSDEASLARVAAQLAKDGLELDSTDGYSSFIATEAQITNLFKARLSQSRSAASSTNGWICETNIESVRLPARYARDIESMAIGHQLCE